MGVMPPDRELKWQKIFRRIGIPTDKPDEKESGRLDRMGYRIPVKH